MRKFARTAVVFLSVMCAALVAEEAAPAVAPAAAKSVLKKGDHVCVVGDSITEQKQYSKFIELYLVACVPQYELRVMQFGWSGERAPGFQARMNNDLLPFAPTVVTTCYGMNDGGYGPYNDNVGQTYRNAMTDIVNRLKAAGVTVVIGSPGAVDTKTYRGGGEAPKIYNETLGKLRDIARELAQTAQMPFADVHDIMMKVMEKAKAEHGEAYDVCGPDGVHPRANGHVLMAYAFLKAMGLDGDLGAITVDLKGQSTATEGHTIVKSDGGTVELQSTRYPFCFGPGDMKSPQSARGILPFVPFNEDLNRLTLIVKNLAADNATVKWGNASKTFTKAELEKGVNLAAAFPDNPFSVNFAKLEDLIGKKQNFETDMIKSFITKMTNFPNWFPNDAEAVSAGDVLKKKFAARELKLQDEVRAAVVPVTHTLMITPADAAAPKDAPAKEAPAEKK